MPVLRSSRKGPSINDLKAAKRRLPDKQFKKKYARFIRKMDKVIEEFNEVAANWTPKTHN